MTWVSLKACYLAVAICMGIERPPRLPQIIVQPGERFECGMECYDYPACTDVRQSYCAGEYYRGRVYVTEGTLAAIPHELMHHILARRGLFDDGSHEGWPWPLQCDRPEIVPECEGFWR